MKDAEAKADIVGRRRKQIVAGLAALAVCACGGAVSDRTTQGDPSRGGRSSSTGDAGANAEGSGSGRGGSSSDATAPGSTQNQGANTTPAAAVPDPGSTSPPPPDQPADTEVVLGPDVRPSAYPGAASWRDTAPPDPTEPCCVVSGPAYVQPATNPGLPATAWSGDGWGVAWLAAGDIVFHALAPDGRGAAAPVTVISSVWNSGPALAWGNGRYALASLVSGKPYQLGLAILTPLGFALWGPTFVPITGGDVYHVAVSRLTTARGWVAAVNEVDDGGSMYLRTYFADDSGNVGNPAGTVLANGAVTGPALANMKSRVALAWGDPNGIQESSFSWPPDTGPLVTTSVLPFPGREDTRIALVPFRDTVVVVAVNPPGVFSAVFDPWDDAVVQGPTRVGDSELFDYGAALASAEERGFIGMCYSRGDQGHQSVLFRVLGPDGSPWKAEQTVAQDLELSARCDVAWSGSEFLVAWWSAGMANNTISVARLQPTF